MQGVKMQKRIFNLGNKATLKDLDEVSFNLKKVRIAAETKNKLGIIRKNLVKIIKGSKAVYGINTGFAEFANKKIASCDLKKLQLNFIRSHSCGTGEPLSDEQVRAVMFLRANEIAKGHSGVRPVIVETLVQFLNKGVIPYVPSRGSVGASGDLAPLAHIGLALIGEGFAKITTADKTTDWMPSKKVLQKTAIKPVGLEEKEGLALANSTQAMQSVGGLTLIDALKLWSAANRISAVSVDALRGTPDTFRKKIHELKPHYGQVETANILTRMLKNSQIRASHTAGDSRVQDSYSLRCIPQVHGAVKQSLDFATKTLETEMQSITDNPIVVWGKHFGDIKVISGGNFHGQSISMAFDCAATAMTVLGNIAERRIFQLTGGQDKLPAYLAENAGVESGFMILQYTAAALASENKTLAHPASADSIPTSANKEDFVSMGMWAAHKFKNIVENTAKILAIELLTSARALEFHRPLKSSPEVEKLYKRLRGFVPECNTDKSYSGDIDFVSVLLLEGIFGGK